VVCSFLREDDLGSGDQIYLPASLPPHSEKIAVCKVMLDAPKCWVRHLIEAAPEFVAADNLRDHPLAPIGLCSELVFQTPKAVDELAFPWL